MSQRVKRIASTVKRAVQEVLVRGLSDPRIRGLVTVTDVEVTDDMRRAIVKISVLPESHANSTIHGLRRATMKIQRKVNDKLALRRPPHLEFQLDDSLKRQAEVLSAINAAIGTHDGDSTGVDDLMDEFGDATDDSGSGAEKEEHSPDGVAPDSVPSEDDKTGSTGRGDQRDA